MVVLLFTALVATGASNAALVKCAAEPNDVRRLACFDGLTKGLVEPKKLPATRSKKWKVETSISPIDDSKTVVASLPAEQRFVASPGRSAKAVLVARCMEKNVALFIVTGTSADVEAGSDEHTGTLRFDKEEAFDVSFSESTDHGAYFFSDGGALINKLLAHDTLLFRFVPYSSSPALVSFDIRGARAPIGQIFEACGRGLLTPGWLRVSSVHHGAVDGPTAPAPAELGKAVAQVDQQLVDNPGERETVCDGTAVLQIKLSTSGTVASWAIVENGNGAGGLLDAALSKVALGVHDMPADVVFATLDVHGAGECPKADED